MAVSAVGHSFLHCRKDLVTLKCGRLSYNVKTLREDLERQRVKIMSEYILRDTKRDHVIAKLKERGYRITKQRLMLLDVILEEDCASCKEIYYKAHSIDAGVGSATVYRMVNLLENIGIFSRKNMYRVACGMDCTKENACLIEFDNGKGFQLNAKEWHRVITEGLKACGYESDREITGVLVYPCTNDCHKESGVLV